MDAPWEGTAVGAVGFDEPTDDLTEALGRGSGRRTALKAVAAAGAGGILALLGVAPAAARGDNGNHENNHENNHGRNNGNHENNGGRGK